MRTAATQKTYAGYKVFSHSSPVYIRVAGAPFRRAAAAGALMEDIERSVSVIRRSYRFASDADKAAALGEFEEGRRVYAKVAARGRDR